MSANRRGPGEKFRQSCISLEVGFATFCERTICMAIKHTPILLICGPFGNTPTIHVNAMTKEGHLLHNIFGAQVGFLAVCYSTQVMATLDGIETASPFSP